MANYLDLVLLSRCSN